MGISRNSHRHQTGGALGVGFRAGGHDIGSTPATVELLECSAVSGRPQDRGARKHRSRATPTVIKLAAHWGSVSARADTTSARRPQPWISLNVLPSPDVRRIEERESINACCRQAVYYFPRSRRLSLEVTVQLGHCRMQNREPKQ